jgi:hypothetical protein
LIPFNCSSHPNQQSSRVLIVNGQLESALLIAMRCLNFRMRLLCGM